jgi:hypothetical protein
MPDLLTVEAIKRGDPITGVIALEPNDPTLHDPERTECPIPAGIIPSSRALERRLPALPVHGSLSGLTLRMRGTGRAARTPTATSTGTSTRCPL